MGAYDGAEVCELVGTYLLSLIAEKYNKNDIGLYRDEGLAIFKNTSGPKNEKIKKVFQRIFKSKGLDIVIQCNMKVVDYLDVMLNFTNYSTGTTLQLATAVCQISAQLLTRIIRKSLKKYLPLYRVNATAATKTNVH